MEKSKVLFLLHLPPPIHGSSLVGNWIKESQKINENFECRYIDLLASSSVDKSGKISVTKLIGALQTFFKLLYQLIFFKPLICYFALTGTGMGFYRDVLLTSIIRVFGVSRLYHLHNKGISEFSKNTINDVLYKFLFQNSKIVILSEYLYFDIEKYVPFKDTSVCFNGVPDTSFGGKQLNRNAQTCRILFFSNLIESKGIYVLLEALSILKNEGVKFDLTIVGGEGDISSIHLQDKISDLELEDCCRYLGKMFDKEKEKIFTSSDLFVFPTYYELECFPLVLLEAMQYSLPVISTFEGGIRDIVIENETGILVKQKDIHSLASAIKLLVEKPELRIKMGKAGRLRYEERFTISHFENKLYSILVDHL